MYGPFGEAANSSVSHTDAGSQVGSGVDNGAQSPDANAQAVDAGKKVSSNGTAMPSNKADSTATNATQPEAQVTGIVVGTQVKSNNS